MNLLLDTHSLIWFLNGDKNLSLKAKSAIEDQNNVKLVSIASIWEIAIKFSIKKFNFSEGLIGFIELIEENNFEIYPITIEHAIEISKLEFIHRDPFDRLLISQCIADNLTLVTKDENIKLYPVITLW